MELIIIKETFNRKQKESLPVVAICYDFDKTLSPDDMQAQGYIQSVGFNIEDFWKESNSLAENNDMDQNLAYMYKMVEEAEGNLILSKETLRDYGAKVSLFDGVDTWFERTKKYGKSKGVIVEHYIISSGLKEMIEGTRIASEIEAIYASSFYFNEKGVAKWPAQVVNYTNKTQFLFRIEKGVLDVNDPGVNDYFSPSEIRVPFRNMIYIGDSDTDIPCMKLVNSYGGHSIGVFNPDTKDKTKVYKMIKDNRIKYFAPADYSENEKLEELVKKIIDRTAANEILESIHYDNANETMNYVTRISRNPKKQAIDNLIVQLSSSKTFQNTHYVVAQLQKIDAFSKRQKEQLFEAAVNNYQIFWILSDNDISRFYKRLLSDYDIYNPNVDKIKEKMKT